VTAEEARRDRGWIAVVGLALVAAAFSVIHPALLLFTPLALLLIALPPRRPLLVVTGALLLLVALWGAPTGALWYFERGWVLVLGGWFVLSVVVWRRASFLDRALSAVGATMASTALLFSVQRGGYESVDWAVAERLRRGASEVAAVWSEGLGFGRVAEQMGRTALQLAELQAQLYPALLGIASLAALAVAWWAYRRLAWKDLSPLGRLREFRFPDALIWLLIGGLVLLVLPLEAPGTRIGTNMLVFMAALYALRGAAVLAAMIGSPGVLAMVIGAVLALLLYPLVLTFAAVVGLTDTWLDIRSRRDAGAGPGR
jgi:hypothetical protein